MTLPTSERLAQILHSRGLFDMEAKARAGIYDDYKSPLSMPILQLVTDLQAAGHHDLAERAIAGEFDATAADAEVWFQKERLGRS